MGERGEGAGHNDSITKEGYFKIIIFYAAGPIFGVAVILILAKVFGWDFFNDLLIVQTFKDIASELN